MRLDTSEEAMLIELGDPFTGKRSFLHIFKSTKFSEAPDPPKHEPVSHLIGCQPQQV